MTTTTEARKARTRVTPVTRIEWNGSATFNVWQSGITADGYVNENVECFTHYNVESVEHARQIADAWWVENSENYPEDKFL